MHPMYYGNNYINGAFEPVFEGHLEFNASNPCNETLYGSFPESSEACVGRAVANARGAFEGWRKVSRVKRAEYFDTLAQLIKRDHDKLKQAISIETGKNLNESHAEVIEALHMCQFAAASGRQPFGECVGSELSTKDAYVIRKPRGVVAVISPWNFPLAIGSFWSSAPALVEGNTVVHKPSELTPMINDMVAHLYHEAGFPKGVYNLIHGQGRTGATLVREQVDVILFTGSAEVAKDIKRHCAETDSKTCCVEAGSKSATIVFEDGDLDLAVDACLASAFKLSGQRCVSSGRLLVQRGIVKEFTKRLLEKIKFHVYVSDPFIWNSEAYEGFSYGPLISQEQMQKVEAFNALVRSDSDATVVYDPDGQEGTLKARYGWKGYYLRPFVYQCEWLDKPFLKNEVFGPHVAIVPFDTLDDAIKIYNDTEYGLALGVITDDFRKHRRLVQECTTGMLYINSGSIAAESHLPFSSWKKSGYGTSAAATWKAVTHSMAVTVNYEEGAVQWAQGMR